MISGIYTDKPNGEYYINFEEDDETIYASLINSNGGYIPDACLFEINKITGTITLRTELDKSLGLSLQKDGSLKVVKD